MYLPAVILDLTNSQLETNLSIGLHFRPEPSGTCCSASLSKDFLEWGLDGVEATEESAPGHFRYANVEVKSHGNRYSTECVFLQTVS